MRSKLFKFLIAFGILTGLAVSQASAQTTLLPLGSDWKYLDDGSDQGTAWQGSGFDDSSWAQGPAPLGYGADIADPIQIVTTNSFGGDDQNKFATYYYRHSFNVTGAGSITDVRANLRRDDGAIVYLNGSEIFRSNMDTGLVLWTNFAITTASDDGQGLNAFYVDGALLQEGANLLAVEIHQANATSSDIVFDLELLGNPQPEVSISSPTNSQTIIGENVSISGTALSGGAFVTLVEVFEGNNKVGESVDGNFFVSWTGVAPGNYNLTAVVTDSSGLKATSAPPVMVTIEPIPASTIVERNAQWRYFKALSEPSSPVDAWRLPGFNDSVAGWATGAAPFFYENGSGFSGNTQLDDMFGNYTGIYLRKTFNLPDPNAIEDLTLEIDSDDGCIVWINGVEVERVNTPSGQIAFNGVSNGAAGEPNQTTTVVSDLSMLVAGVNVVAVHALNSSVGSSSDFIFSMVANSSIDAQPPVQLDENPPRTAVVRQLTQIEITFSEDITNVDASDLLINGVPASTVSFGAPGSVTFGFVQPAVGPVTIEWIPAHGITDVSFLMNAFAGGSWSYVLDPDAEPPGIIINEFMASNDNTLNDEDGQSSDWIELKNAGSISGNMDGWYLTDNALNLTKWRLPAVTILPNDYLIIFASSKNRSQASGELHANFNLPASGSYLALVEPDGTTIASEFSPSYPSQLTDVSYGADRANPEIKGFFSEPTPGEANASSGPGFAESAQFSHVSRTFLDDFTLTLSAAPGATIRFTTSTNFPTEESTAYSGPITIDSTTIIRTRVFQPGLLPSAPRTEHFIQVSQNARSFTSDLPIIIMHNYGRGAVPSSGEQYVAMMVFEPKGGGRSSITNAPDVATGGRFRLRGSSTQGYPKGSWAFESWDEFFDDKAITPMGLPAESDWVFYAPNNFDLALIHNPLAYQLHRDMGRYASRTRFVEVLLKDDTGVPGPINIPAFNGATDYNGIYAFEEKLKVDKNRIDIDRLRPENVTGLGVTGGYLLKIDRADPGDSGFNAPGNNVKYVDPDETSIETPQRDPQQQYITGFFNDFGNALNGANYRDPDLGFRRYLDEEAAIFHHIHNVVTFNVDALRLSGYFYKTRDRTNDLGQLIPGKITYGPSWDFDRTQGSTDGRDFNPTTFRSTVPDLGTDFFNYPWWSRMFTDPDFWQLWIDRYQQHRKAALSTNHVFGVIEGMFDELREAEERERTRWNQQPRNGVRSGAGYTFDFGDREFDSELRFKRQWFNDRFNFIDSQFLAMPTLSHSGGEVAQGFVLTISGPPGSTIYYTLNGTDPRARGGNAGSVQPAPGAITYSGPITINANARVVARVRNPSHNNVTGANNPPITSHWSGPAEATYIVQTPTLLITEIMYNPRPGPGGIPDAQQLEFLEIKNVGAATINLAGTKFTRGIEFEFTSGSLAPGAHVVVAKNPAAFTARYGAGANVVGPYVGFLDNGGERITLQGSLQEPLLDFTYNDGWYRVTDGSGFSLVLVDETAPLRTDLDLKTSWRVSTAVNGSPGADDPAPLGLPGVRVNEVLTHTDLPALDTFEIHNPTASPADISGWFLTDDFGDPVKFVIPPGTIIPAGGYMLFNEDDFNQPADPRSFSLSSAGDEAYIFSGNGTEITGYVHGFDFGAALNGVTFGRHVISTGGDQYPRQSAPTLGAVNAGPGVGPIVVSEIMYHPPDLAGGFDNADDEFIELYNTSAATVSLFDPANPGNVWRLRNAVDFDFPAGTQMSGFSYLLVVNFDPVADPTELTAFRTRNGISPSVPIVGPWSGKLDNSDENVELKQPDNPDPMDLSVNYPLVERIKYEDAAPWPQPADGFGPSLQRVAPGDFGNDPANWVAAGKTPGAPYGGGAAPIITVQPAETTVIAFMDATFTVSTDPAAGPYTYQWLYEGATIPGATGQTLIVPRVQPFEEGNYQVLVLNSASSIASDPARLNILIPARILAQPQPVSVVSGEDVALSVAAESNTPITYQWRKNGIPILGATTAVLQLTNVQPIDDAIYDVVLTDGVGPVASDGVRITVLVAPTILFPTANVGITRAAGSSLTLCITVTNTATLPVSYRWRRGGATLAIKTLNSRTDFITIDNLQTTDRGAYTCVVTNEAFFAPGFLSGRTTLTVGAAMDMDGDGMPDDYEDANGLDKLVDDTGLDPDLDGFTNGEEFVAGTDPQDGESFLKIEEIDKGSAIIRFIAQPGKTYAVQYRDEATNGPWQFLDGICSDSEVAHMAEITDNALVGGSQRFYRLVTPGTTDSEAP